MADQVTVTYEDGSLEVVPSGTNVTGDVLTILDAYGKKLEWIPLTNVKKVVNTGS